MSVPADYNPLFVCTLKTCSVKLWGYIHYQPSIPGNVLFLVLIDALALAQLIMGIYYRTGLVAVVMLLGLACESLGYIARILMHYDPFSRAYFLWYLVTLTLGPAFLAGGIYLCLGRIVVLYGEDMSRFKPKTYTYIFMGCDFFSLVVQALGGGIAASFPLTNKTMIDLGTHILVAGLAIQVASLFVFSVCAIEFGFRVRARPEQRKLENAEIYNSKRFKLFLLALALACVLLFIRTVFRSVELSGGFSGPLANSEVEFMILDGVMVILASAALTIMHPGVGFGKQGWADAKFRFRKTKNESTSEGETVAPTVDAEKSGGEVTLQERGVPEVK